MSTSGAVPVAVTSSPSITTASATGSTCILIGYLLHRSYTGKRTVPVEVYMSESQYGYWRNTHLTIDVVHGRGAGFSVEAPTGQRFLIRSRMLTDEEVAHFGLLPRL
ncbi:DUF779 domain-containing protein [Tessaracoccus sp. HDW20]|uniref:DUF779 domain-containing protein n=1 Tax=Tessaracoccus coleopterorum TaxID=2714950 RepID=UPI0018D2DC1B|nr:DUF779 domain-containing protein [Tessaracoccus coleopterorum]NHB84629.1 DUF779 domain-containing protein [Tessaracoccus coleopterorum]